LFSISTFSKWLIDHAVGQLNLLPTTGQGMNSNTQFPSLPASFLSSVAKAKMQIEIIL